MSADAIYKVAIGPIQQQKIPPGAEYWREFNGSFRNSERNSLSFAEDVWCGRPFTTWHARCWRHSNNFELGQHLAIDFDTGDARSSLAELLKDPFIAKRGAMVYTTPSHTPAAPRARVVFLLDTPIQQAANYTTAASALLWLYGSADRQCKDAVRFFYGGRPGHCEIEHLGQVLPLDVVKDLVRRYRTSGAEAHRRVTHPTYQPTASQTELAEALRSIPAWGISYDQWLTTLMGIHSAFPGGDGLALAESWGQGYKGEVEAKWRGFHGDGGVTVASVFGLAKSLGWRGHVV